MNNEKCAICLKPMGNSLNKTNGIPVNVKCDGINMILKKPPPKKIEKMKKFEVGGMYMQIVQYCTKHKKTEILMDFQSFRTGADGVDIVDMYCPKCEKGGKRKLKKT